MGGGRLSLKNDISSAIRKLEKTQKLLSTHRSDIVSYYSDSDQRIQTATIDQNIATLNFIKNILLDARKISLDEVKGLKKLKPPEVGGLSILRILRIQAYLAMLWSIYDQICNLALRLCGHPHTTANQSISTISPMIFDFIKPGKNSYIGRIVPSLFYKHGKPILHCYALRNQFLHEGGGTHSLFQITANDEYALALDETAFLNIEVKNDYKLSIGDPDGWPWKDSDNIIHLDKFLERAQQHLDTAHGTLLSWIIDGFSKEIELILK